MRSRGHNGIAVTAYVYDRAIHDPATRKLFARHDAWWREDIRPQERNALLLKLLEWNLQCACACHDIHNSLKWSMASHVDADALRDLHIALATLQNSFCLLVGHQLKWIAAVVCFREQSTVVAEARNFWSVLQVGEDHVARFAVLDPEFLDGKLWVNPGVGGDCVDVLAQMQLHVMRFANFSDSRWLGSGSGTRTLVKCVRMGISHLANYTRADPHATDYHLHGIERLNTKLMVSVIIIAVSSQVSDDMMKSVLADDRVAAKLDELKEIQSTALKFQAGIPL